MEAGVGGESGGTGMVMIQVASPLFTITKN